MNADRLRRLAELRKGAMIENNQRQKPLGIPADDGEHQRQIVARGADDRFRAAADADPSSELAAFDRRKDALVVQRRAYRTLPGHGLPLEQRREQIELFLEQFF